MQRFQGEKQLWFNPKIQKIVMAKLKKYEGQTKKMENYKVFFSKRIKLMFNLKKKREGQFGEKWKNVKIFLMVKI